MATELMPNATEAEDADAEYMRRLDELADRLNISYDEARERLGKPPYEEYGAAVDDQPITSQTPRAKRARGTAHIGPQYGEEETYLDGGERVDPHYYESYTPLAPEEAARRAATAKRGADLARRALHGD